MSDDRFRLYLIKTKTDRGRFRKLRTVDLHIELMQRLRVHAPDLTISQVERYLLSLLESNRKGSYVNDYIDTLHLYGRYLGVDIYEKLEYFPEEEFVQATMSEEEIKAFLTLPPPTTTRYDPRKKQTISYTYGEKQYQVWTLFFKILAFTGMRPGEVAHLTIEKIDFGRGVIVLPAEDVKTNTFRHIPIAPALLHDLTEYIKNLSGDYLFPATKGGKSRDGKDVINDVDWGYNFHQRLKRLGIKRKNLRPSSLRPSFITRMLDEDISLSKVQKIVGHKRITTTAHYTHLTTKDIIQTIKQDPLGRKHLTKTERLLQGRRALEDLGFIVPVAQDVNGKFLYEVLDE